MSFIRDFFRAETENIVTKLLKISSEAKKVMISSRNETMWLGSIVKANRRRGEILDVCFAPLIQTHGCIHTATV